jgi:hypothetical protein
MNKIQVTQDTLYEYLTAHDVKMIRLSELLDCSNDTLTACFQHRKDKHGNPRTLSPYYIAKINDVLPRLAEEIEARLLKFGSERMYTNTHGRTYDPGMIEPMKELGKYLNITSLTRRLLGWSQNKKSSVLCRPNAINYGSITEQDVVVINTEALAVAAVLSSYKL